MDPIISPYGIKRFQTEIHRFSRHAQDSPQKQDFQRSGAIQYAAPQARLKSILKITRKSSFNEFAIVKSNSCSQRERFLIYR